MPGVLAAIIILSLAPIVPYAPGCKPHRSPTIQGPLREQYLQGIDEVFDRERIIHVRIGGTIYWPLLELLDRNFLLSFVDEPFFRSRHDLLINTEWKLASSIADDMFLDGTIPPSAVLMEAIRASEQTYGPYPRVTEDGDRIYGPDERFTECELMRLAIVEDDASTD